VRGAQGECVRRVLKAVKAVRCAWVEVRHCAAPHEDCQYKTKDKCEAACQDPRPYGGIRDLPVDGELCS
jgi:hypothetical protein